MSAGNYKTQAGKVIGDPGISVNNNFSNIYVYHNLENGYIDEGVGGKIKFPFGKIKLP